jgi:glyoxylase-like metal-dependent hydrolase (beta-lactamase superfamily II)
MDPRRNARTRWLARGITVAAVVLVLLGLFLATFAASPLPPPSPLAGPLPPASPPASMAVFQLPTGVTHRSAAFAYRGSAFRDRRDFAMTAVLVRHPRGDLLVDTGFGRDIDAHFRRMPYLFRAATSYQRTRSAAEQLDAAGYDRRSLRAVVLTHAHWDHVSGVPEFPGTPVWVTAEYAFDGGAYLGFPRSHDVYGDGAVVIVPAPGHTPGSVVVFLALPSGRRYALVGDLVWQREGITEREERPWLQRALADADPRAVRDNILRMAAIAARFPALTIVPAHDARAFAEMPRL